MPTKKSSEKTSKSKKTALKQKDSSIVKSTKNAPSNKRMLLIIAVAISVVIIIGLVIILSINSSKESSPVNSEEASKDDTLGYRIKIDGIDESSVETTEEDGVIVHRAKRNLECVFDDNYSVNSNGYLIKSDGSYVKSGGSYYNDYDDYGMITCNFEVSGTYNEDGGYNFSSKKFGGTIRLNKENGHFTLKATRTIFADGDWGYDYNT